MDPLDNYDNPCILDSLCISLKSFINYDYFLRDKIHKELLRDFIMDNRFKQTLVDLAIANDGIRGRIKLAAGVVYKNRLVAVGKNSYKTHPLMGRFGKNPEAVYLHAEIDAIKNALRVLSLQQLEKSDILVVRVKRDGHDYQTCLAKPCEGCMRAITTFNLRNLYYTE